MISSILEVLKMLTLSFIWWKKIPKLPLEPRKGELRWDWNVISPTIITLSSSLCLSYQHWLPAVFTKYVAWPFAKFFWNLPPPKHTQSMAKRHLVLKSIKDWNTQAKREWSTFYTAPGELAHDDYQSFEIHVDLSEEMFLKLV